MREDHALALQQQDAVHQQTVQQMRACADNAPQVLDAQASAQMKALLQTTNDSLQKLLKERNELVQERNQIAGQLVSMHSIVERTHATLESERRAFQTERAASERRDREQKNHPHGNQ